MPCGTRQQRKTSVTIDSSAGIDSGNSTRHSTPHVEQPSSNGPPLEKLEGVHRVLADVDPIEKPLLLRVGEQASASDGDHTEGRSQAIAICRAEQTAPLPFRDRCRWEDRGPLVAGQRIAKHEPAKQ
mgnify:CR=1 FL=1